MKREKCALQVCGTDRGGACGGVTTSGDLGGSVP